ncbi:MAG: hypothetical protein J1F05_02420 [Muribaculaceae bacterium]|nr:hypothetical protein [Muribaculaceae bacterium]
MKLNKVLSTLFGAALIFGAWACTEQVKYDPAPAYDGDDVYFSNEQSTEVLIPSEATSVSVLINRVKSDQEHAVSLTASVTDANGNAITDIFTLPSTVVFASGKNQAEVVVGVDFDKVEAEVPYYLNLAVTGDVTSPYGASSAVFAMKYSPWSDFKRLGGNEGYALVTLSAFVDYVDEPVPVYLSESLVSNRYKYQFGDYECPDLQPDENRQGWVVNGSNAIINYDEDNDILTWEVMDCGLEVDGAELYVCDVYTYVKEVNPNATGGTPVENFAHASKFFVENGLMGLNAIYFTSKGILMQIAEYFQLPGYAQYAMAFNYQSNVISKPDNQEAAQIQIRKSDDIHCYAFEFIEGALTDEQVDAKLAEIEANTDAELHYESSAVYEYYLRRAGTYTIVAVGYDAASNVVYETSWAFEYEPSLPITWESVGYAEYTDGFIYCAYGVPAYTWDVEVEQSLIDPDLIRIVNPYKSGNGWGLADASYDIKGNHYITINIADPDFVYINESPIGLQLSSSDGTISVYSRAKQLIDQGRSVNQVKRQGWGGKIDDGVITFPGGTLLIGWSKIEEYEYTNFDVTIPSNDQNAQMASTGEFYLDLSSCSLSDAAGKPAKKAANAVLKGVKVNKAMFKANKRPRR